jgi:hypothetical protein
MRNRVFSLWIVVALVVLDACALTVEGNPVVPTATGLSATLEAPARLPDGNTVIVQFTLTNNSDVDLYVLKWYTPMEGIGGEIFRVERDGQAIPYTGILAMRGDPTPEGYQPLEAGQSASAEVDLATSFDFSQAGEYTIEFLSPGISHVARSEAEMATSVDELGPVDMPSNTVTLEIGGTTDELGEPPAGNDLMYYQGASPFYPDAQPFELAYSPSVWDYVPGDEPNHADHLRHHEMAHCSLWLGGGGSRATPVSTANLADHEWTISQVRPDFLDYSTLRDRGVLAFGLRLPERYKADVKGPCQELAEDVLGTIEVPGRPLPPSTKGYELYSWYEEDGAWYFTLITGSNRLKTLEEIRARTNVVGPDGWASILVRGTGPLKTLLRRLPSGEQVTWIGAEWLQQAGADPEMIDTMRLPDGPTVAEIEDFCRQQDLSLTVTGAPSATPVPEPTPRPSRTLVLEVEDQGGGGAQPAIHEIPIVDAEVIGPGRFEYDDQLGPEVLARIATLRAQSAERALARTNAVLAPFGYHLESLFDAGRNKTLYDLYGPGETDPPLARLLPLWRLPLTASVNASGSDFILVAENGAGTGPMYWLVNSDGSQEWEPSLDPSLRPGYVDDALARVTATGHPTITYQVELDGRAVHTGTAVAYGAYMPLRSFTTWDDHWVLGVDDHLIMDGQDIGQTLGYDAAFGFARIGDRPFYFFEKDGLVQISYGGQVLPNAYEQVFHNHCCEAAIHNVEFGPEAVWFHALRDGVWYWAEARTLASSGADEPADDELALQSLVDFFVHLSAGQYEEASQLYGGPYEVLIEYNPTLDPQDHAALLRNACTINGFQCLRVHSARLQEDLASGAEFRFLVEFSTPNGELLVRGPCCGASETDMPPESAFLFTVSVSRDGEYRVQDLPVYIP